MFDRIQNIRNINGDNNIIINGDVFTNSEALTKFARHILKKDLEKLTNEARRQMNDSINDCIRLIFEQIQAKHIEYKLSEFSNPSTQIAYYATLKGFAISETLEQRDFLVDAFIERIQQSWNSTEKMIIDSALDVIPLLTPQTLSTLGLFQLRHQMFYHSFSFMLDIFFSELTTLAEKMETIDVLGIEYLKQKHLILPLPGFQTTVSLETLLLTNYDLFFRHPINDKIYEEYCKEFPVAHYAINEDPSHTGCCMMGCSREDYNELSFRFANSSILKKILQKGHQDYIIPHVDKLMQMMPPFTEEEVRNYFIKLSPSWERLFNLFASNEFTQYSLSITGKYIGGKILAKVSNSTPLPLSEYNKENTL